jgi:hypothetical protein
VSQGYPHELLVDAGVHAEVARVWTDEPAELAACRRLVAFYCLYGVDKNPLAVELARVSLWLATAASDHPLTFLNHRLVPGDSLLGITVDDLLRGIYRKKTKKALTGDEPHQGELALYFSRAELDARLQRAFRHLREIDRLETEQPGDFEDQQMASLIMQQELAPFVEAHYLRIGRAFLEEDDPAADPMIPNRWMQEIQDQHLISEETRTSAEVAIAKGKEVRAFCWELTFPELFFEPDTVGVGIRNRERPGFDVMVGNPPWEKIRPYQKEFFARFDPAIGDFQGQTLKRRVAKLAPPNSKAAMLWRQYSVDTIKLASLLLRGGIFQSQLVQVNGQNTGSDPELSRFFLERNYQLTRQNGRVAVLMPASIFAVEGATGLRILLFSKSRIEAVYSFENWGKRFFPIHSSFKFSTLIFEKTITPEQSFPAAFMLRDEGFLSLPLSYRQNRSVNISTSFIHLTSPNSLSIIELRDESEYQLVERIYRSVPTLGVKLEGNGVWNPDFHTELALTHEAWRLLSGDWLLQHDCVKKGSVLVAQTAEWYAERGDRYVPGSRWIVPDGTKYRIQSSPPEGSGRNRNRANRQTCVQGFLLRNQAHDENELPVIPSAHYVPMYEGRMVHQFDHAAKAYVTGEGRGAKWRELSLCEKELIPHFYVKATDSKLPIRAGYCDVTGQTNERSVLATILPADYPAGNSVYTVVIKGFEDRPHLPFVACANSFAGEFLIRQMISTHLNVFIVKSWPLVRPRISSAEFSNLERTTARLVSTTPEIRLNEPIFNAQDRARARAEIDAIVASLYDLSPAEFAYILTTFPLLDRDQPPLPEDFFVRWNKEGKPKFEPRSYVTRDTALLAYFRHRGTAPPEDVAVWYRDEVKVNMIDDEFCPFRMGPIRNLEQRVPSNESGFCTNAARQAAPVRHLRSG